MGTIVSALVFTKRDTGGNRFVEAWMLGEFRTISGYPGGGENFNLTSYFQRVDRLEITPASGALAVAAEPNWADYPANAGSGRILAKYLGSAIVGLNISGIGISVASGQLLIASAVYMVTSGNAPASIMFSGRIAAVASGDLAPGYLYTEILSGTALSGSRVTIHAIGY